MIYDAAPDSSILNYRILMQFKMPDQQPANQIPSPWLKDIVDSYRPVQQPYARVDYIPAVRD